MFWYISIIVKNLRKKEQENIVPTQIFYCEQIVRIFVFFSTPVSSYLPYCLQLYF